MLQNAIRRQTELVSWAASRLQRRSRSRWLADGCRRTALHRGAPSYCLKVFFFPSPSLCYYLIPSNPPSLPSNRERHQCCRPPLSCDVYRRESVRCLMRVGSVKDGADVLMLMLHVQVSGGDTFRRRRALVYSCQARALKYICASLSAWEQTRADPPLTVAPAELKQQCKRVSSHSCRFWCFSPLSACLFVFFMCLSVTVRGETHEEEINSIEGAPHRTSTAQHLSYRLHLLAFPSPNLATLLIAAFVLLISAALYLPRVKPVSFALCSLASLELPPLASAVRFPLNTRSIFDSNRRTEQRY